MNKIVQDMKVEIESMKKTQMEVNLEMKCWGIQGGTSEASLTNKLPYMKERLSGNEDKIEKNWYLS